MSNRCIVTGCEDLLQQCTLALIGAFSSVVIALVALVKSHDAQNKIKEKEEF